MNGARSRTFNLRYASIADVAFVLVFVGAAWIIPAFIAALLIGWLLFPYEWRSFLVLLGLAWLGPLVVTWVRYVRIGRAHPELGLGAGLFFQVQIAAGAFTLALHLLFPWGEVAQEIRWVGIFLEGLVLMTNVVYLSLVYAIGRRPRPRTFLGSAVDLVVILATHLFGKA